jgi:hypothetical protein
LEFYTFVADNYTAFYSLPSECTRIKKRWKRGRVEEWKGGRMEEWKGGRVEGWKRGRVEGRSQRSLFTVLEFGVRGS